jgi:two-component system sensor histidine kinase QseC
VKTHLQVMGLALERDPAAAAVAQALVHASEGVLRMQRTLEQLLLLARLDGDLETGDGEAADAFDAASEAARDAEAGSGNPGRVRLAGAAQAMAVAVPQVLLVSALRNLLDNALRYATDASPVLLEIEADGAHRVRFTVLDRGPGMTQAECEQAVERFWRRSKTPLGSGLGLSIVSTIAMRYQGEIRLAPRPEGGLQAQLTLPAASP